MKTDISFRHLATFALPGLCWALVASTTACGDDDDTSGDTAGTAGSSAGKGSGGNSTGGKSGGGTNTGGKDGGGTNAGGKSGGGTDAGGTDTGGTDTGGSSAGEAGTPGVQGGEAGMTGGGGDGGGTEVTEAVPLIINAAPTGHDRFYNSTFDAAGNLYAVGQITSSNDATADIATLVAKFTPQGKLDTTFGNGGLYVRNVANGTNGELFRSIVVQTTGKIVVFGSIEHAGGPAADRDAALMRINADGTKDTTFGLDGILVLDLSTGIDNPKTPVADKLELQTRFSVDSGWGMAKYADDRLALSAGMVRKDNLDTDFVILRLSADGARDQGFGINGQVAVDTKVMVGAEEIHNNASPRNVTILPGTDGIIGAGYQPKPGGDTQPVVYKITDAGVLDDTFGDHGVFHTALLAEQTESYSAVVQPIAAGGYKLVTTGYGRKLAADTTDIVSMRLTSSGELDPTYGEDGNGLLSLDIGGFGDNSRNVLVLPDRRIVLVGGGRLTSANVDGIVTVLLPDGAPDTTVGPDGWKRFDLGGPADFLWGAALSPDAKTLGIVGIKGAGNAPMPASAADDAAALWLPVP